MTKAALEMVIPAGEPIIEYRRFFAAPSELVFQAFTDPEHLAHWRGPEELQMVSCDIDLRVGGRYRYVHRGPDGQDHVFRGEYREVRRPQRLVSTFVYEAFPENEAVETLIFDEVDGGTMVTSRSILPSFKARDLYIATGAERGLEESCRRLDQWLNSSIGVGQVA